MSIYTMQVRAICEIAAGYTESQNYSKVDEIVTKAAPTIFENFPIFNESHRLDLEKKILRHYYFNEIGQETVGRWKLSLNNKLNEIMPYYNELYKTAAMVYEPLEDVNYTRDVTDNGSTERTVNGSSSDNGSIISENSGNTHETGTNYDLHSNTPQGDLSGFDGNKYLSSGDKHIINTTNTSDSEGKTTTNNVNISHTNDNGISENIRKEHVKGKMSGRTYQSMIEEYRKLIINIDMQIVYELKNCFMQIY